MCVCFHPQPSVKDNQNVLLPPTLAFPSEGAKDKHNDKIWPKVTAYRKYCKTRDGLRSRLSGKKLGGQAAVCGDASKPPVRKNIQEALLGVKLYYNCLNPCPGQPINLEGGGEEKEESKISMST